VVSIVSLLVNFLAKAQVQYIRNLWLSNWHYSRFISIQVLQFSSYNHHSTKTPHSSTITFIIRGRTDVNLRPQCHGIPSHTTPIIIINACSLLRTVVHTPLLPTVGVLKNCNYRISHENVLFTGHEALSIPIFGLLNEFEKGEVA
jgi:hypothetical protein